MKWNAKQHEFDNEYQKMKDILIKKIYIFGAGTKGLEMSVGIQKFFNLVGFIDNDKEKQEKEINGYRVYKLNDIMDDRDDVVIIISTAGTYLKEIVYQLEEIGCAHKEHFFYRKEFIEHIMPILLVYGDNKVFVPLTQICITERCTLKCQKCAHACYAVDSSNRDMKIDEVCRSADIFFSKVDYIYEFVLIGGEPLLYEKLNSAIVYIGQKYRDKMNIFSITTNGTILPSIKTLQLCKEFNILYRISNYSKQNNWLVKKYEKLESLLKKNEIHYCLGKPDVEWMDYGFEYVNRECNETELIKAFDACNTPCKEIRGNRLYFCVMARSVSDNLGLGLGEEDYLDLNILNGENWRKEFIEYTLGFSEKGYLDMCRHCHGAESSNYPIPAAKQL